MTTPEELEVKAQCIAAMLGVRGDHEEAETISELVVRYRASRIAANNYKKALEALEHA